MRVIKERIVEVKATEITKIVDNSPDRLVLLMMNIGKNDAYVMMKESVEVGKGLKLLSGGGLMSMNVKDDYELTKMPFYGIAEGGDTTFYVLEILEG